MHSTLKRAGLTGCVLIFLGLTPLSGAYMFANLNGNPSFNECGSLPGIDPGTLCYGSPNVPSVSVTGPVPGAGDGKAATTYGTNRVLASSSGGSMGASSEWMVLFTLTGGTMGEKVPLTILIDYDVTLSAASGQASFSFVLNFDYYSPWRIATSTDPYLGDGCFDRPGKHMNGDCAGTHSGRVSRTLEHEFRVGPNNRIMLGVGAGVFGTGVVDAFNTVKIAGVVVPDGYGWDYFGLTGNPLNFHHVSPAAVPEPGSAALVLLGVAALGVSLRRRSANRV
jgi:hypothetical protein